MRGEAATCGIVEMCGTGLLAGRGRLLGCAGVFVIKIVETQISSRGASRANVGVVKNRLSQAFFTASPAFSGDCAAPARVVFLPP